MRKYCNGLVRINREHKTNNIKWRDRVITEVADYAQNIDVPHFGLEQLGNTYYFSPLGVYVFGIVCLYNKVQDLVAQYYYKLDEKKDGNNVASLIYNKFKVNRWVEK